MKKSTLLSTFLAASVAATSLPAATSDVVGYITVTVAGTGGVGSQAFTFMGNPMQMPAEAAGSVDSFAASSIVDSSQSWTENDFQNTHFVIITSGANEGVTATIASNTSDTLTTVEDISSFLSGGESFQVRAYTTIADIFGASNESGIDGGSAAGNADNILIQNGASFDTYYYKDSGLLGGTGWRSSASPSVDESGTVVPFGTGIIVVRSQESDLDVVISGSVLSSDAVTPVESDFNWKSSSFPVAVSLSDMFGAANEAGLDGGSAAGNADNILVPDATGAVTTYYYKDSGLLGGTGWRSSASPSVDESATIIAQPGGFFYINRTGGSGINLSEASPL